MQVKSLVAAAGGGLVERRSFLRKGLSLGALAVAADALHAESKPSAPIGDQLPRPMKTPGGGDAPYGLPTVHESKVTPAHARRTPRCSAS